MIGETRSQSRRNNGIKSTEGMVSLEERNSSFSEKVVHSCSAVIIRAGAEDMANDTAFG